MKKLLLFCLLASVPAFGQAYSSSVTQNSPGNYGRPVPYATVLVCGVTDTAVPCTTKVPTFTTQTLTTQCSSNAGSGVLTGAPTSGTNCNNPGIADINGNFTIYVAPGQYMICTYANNWLCQPQSIASGPTTTFNCVGALNGSIMATINPTTASCDPNMGTDFAGNGFSQSWKYLGPVNGFFGVIGGTSDPGTQAKFKLNTNEVRMLGPLTVPTPYYWRIPGTRCAVGQVWQMTGETTDANGDKVDTYGCLTPSSGVSITATSPIVVTPSPITGTGVISCPTCSTGSSAPQASNPSAPVLTTNGTPGSTSYTYLVVGCEDGPTCAYHSAASATAIIATGNATLSGTNSINLKTYADRLYGYRCYNIYRTASAGTPSTTGKIATCVWKSFIDTGLSGDSTTAPNTNTTVLDANGLTNPLPGCNKVPAAPYGIDGVPCSPNALDDEFTWGNGTWVPGDTNNPFWTQSNGIGPALSLTNGMLSVNWASGGTSNLRCILQPVPASTPWEFVTLLYFTNANPTGSTEMESGIGLFETSSGKYSTHMLDNNNSGAGFRFLVRHWSNVTTNVNAHVDSNITQFPNGIYIGVRDDGTTLHYEVSADGIVYTDAFSELITAAFTTAPSSLGICANTQGTSLAVFDYDYWRRRQ